MKRIIIISIVVLFMGLVAFVCTLSWIGCDKAIHPETEVSPYKLSEFDLPAEDVRFNTRDGLTLAGWFIPGINGATVILVHGMESTRRAMLPHANYLNEAGYSVLLYDSRGRGKSEGDTITLGAKELWDIEAAVDYLKTRTDVDLTRIGVQGSSLGAASAILAAAKRQEIKGVVAQIPFKSVNGVLYHTYPQIVGLPAFPFVPITKFICECRLGVNFDDVDPSKVIDTISPRPVFLIDELEDELFPPDSVEVLYEAAREPKMLWQIPGAQHGKGFETEPEGYSRRVLEFWRQTFWIVNQEPANGG
ncbi:MAG: alpha/beta hydrolase [Pseudomonadota bacterium]